MPICVRSERRAIENGTDKAAFYVFFSPGVRNDVMIIEITVLRDIACHPVSRPLKDEKVKNAIVN